MLPCRPAACLLVLIVVPGLLSRVHLADARPEPEHGPHGRPDGAAWRSFELLLDARRGAHATGLGELKLYLARFGYMPTGTGHDPTDAFDEHLEAAVMRYQARLSLPVTGRLDSGTLDQIMSPRCGVGDDAGHADALSPAQEGGAVSRFTFFKGEPRWPTQRSADPIVLTYAVSPTATVDYLPPDAVQAVFRRAFQRWARAIPVSFVETEYYDEADIRVGFYKGSHGDGVPFDGPLGVLGHAFSPKNGRLHLDAAERWAIDFAGAESEASPIHLESVATHEIGHVLGLGHSTSPHAVMYPTIKPRQTRVDLTVDDVEGVQQLYGPNPDFSLNSLYESDPSGSPARSSWVAWSARTIGMVLVILVVTHF